MLLYFMLCCNVMLRCVVFVKLCYVFCCVVLYYVLLCILCYVVIILYYIMLLVYYTSICLEMDRLTEVFIHVSLSALRYETGIPE